MTVTDSEPLEATEEQRVRWWRQDALERAGYGVGPAAELARCRHVDLHQALELVRKGCPPDLALRILR